MKRILLGAPALLLLTGLVAAWSHGTEEFDEFEVFIEINSTDGDAGLQGKLDGGPWRRASVVDGHYRTVFELQPRRNLAAQGMSEIQWESAEPNFDDFSLGAFLHRFPSGRYKAFGRKLNGRRLASSTRLTHDLPAGPEITSPAEDELELDGSNVLVTWNEVTEHFCGGDLDSDIIGYEVVCEIDEEVDGEEVTRVLKIDVAPDEFSAEIPADFIRPDGEYKFEIGAIEESGNRTFTEISVCTVEAAP